MIFINCLVQIFNYLSRIWRCQNTKLSHVNGIVNLKTLPKTANVPSGLS